MVRPARRRRQVRGFTLVELMMAVGIIGILASIAVPSAQQLVQKVKEKEEEMIATQLVRDIKTKLDRDGTIPATHSYTDGRTFHAPYNPPLNSWPPSGKKKKFLPNMDSSWAQLDSPPDGWVYHHYMIYAYQYPGYMNLYVYTYGDVDGDGKYEYHYRGYYLDKNELVKHWDYRGESHY